MQLSPAFLFKALCLPILVSALPALRSRAQRYDAQRSTVPAATVLLQRAPSFHNSLSNEVQANGQDTSLHENEQKVEYDPLYFGLMIDAGSSGTRIRMFKWTLRRKVDLIEVMPVDGDEDNFEVHPGLDSYADDPEAALPPLSGILKAAQRYVPKAIWEESLLFLKATAGMRILERRKSRRLMDTVRAFLADSDNCPFKFVSAEIISGEEEALFSFITTNYDFGTLSSPTKIVGALEMGGASMQVVFRPTSDIQDNEFQFYLSGQRESVYAKSYLRFGIDEAMKRMLSALVQRKRAQGIPIPGGLDPDREEVESPCHNQGWKKELVTANGEKHNFTGTGNATDCSEMVRKVMGLDIECLMPPCAIFGSYMPPVEGDFYAFAGFFFTVNGLGLVGWKDAKALTVEEVADATATYCAKDMTTAQQDSGQPLKYAQNYCFMGTYVHESLAVFGFRESNSRVTFSRKLSGFNLGWPAGAMLYETHLMPFSLKAHEGVRGLCGPPAKFDRPPDRKGGVSGLRLSTLAFAVAAFARICG